MRETALHWLMFAEVGVPMLAAVFLKVNALLLLFMGACWIAHEVTTHMDLRLAIATRYVSAFGQQVLAFLDVLPVVAILLLALLHWDQAGALLGLGAAAADFSLSLKPPPSASELILLFAAISVFGCRALSPTSCCVDCAPAAIPMALAAPGDLTRPARRWLSPRAAHGVFGEAGCPGIRGALRSGRQRVKRVVKVPGCRMSGALIFIGSRAPRRW